MKNASTAFIILLAAIITSPMTSVAVGVSPNAEWLLSCQPPQDGTTTGQVLSLMKVSPDPFGLAAERYFIYATSSSSPNIIPLKFNPQVNSVRIKHSEVVSWPGMAQGHIEFLVEWANQNEISASASLLDIHVTPAHHDVIDTDGKNKSYKCTRGMPAPF